MLQNINSFLGAPNRTSRARFIVRDLYAAAWDGGAFDHIATTYVWSPYAAGWLPFDHDWLASRRRGLR
jgi:hypothetical protein